MEIGESGNYSSESLPKFQLVKVVTKLASLDESGILNVWMVYEVKQSET